MADITDISWRQAVRSLWRGLLCTGLFSMALNLLMLALPLYSMAVSSRVLGSGHVETLLLLSLVAGLALVILGLLDMVRATLLGRLAMRFEMHILPTAMHAAFPAHPAQAMRDLAAVRQMLTGPGVAAIFDAPWLPLALGVLWMLHPLIAGYVGASALLLAFLAVANDLVTARAFREAGQSAQIATALAEAMTRRREAVAGLGMLDTLVKRLAKLDATALVHSQTGGERTAVLVGLTRAVRLGVQAGVMGIAAWLILKHELTPGAMMATSILAGKALAPVEQMVVTWKGVGPAREGWRRLRKLLADRLPASRTALTPETGRLDVENLSVASSAGGMLLSNVAFRLEEGECLVVVGPSGAGKSTLCRAIAGTIPDALGSVRLDGARLDHYAPDRRAMALGYLPQDVGLLPGTIAQNIARMEETPDARSVVEAARLAGAHETILSLPEGYDTRLEEGGFPLSGGQRQRVGLARALYGEPRLVVLDEPNASLDAGGEAALAACIARLKAKGVTLLLVTHRPHLLQLADKVLVLEAGMIGRFGAKDAVLAALIRPTRAA